MILMIFEKNSVLKEMAEIFGWKKSSLGFEGTFEGKPIIGLAVRGHILRLKNPDEVDPALQWGSHPSAYMKFPNRYEYILADGDKPDTPTGYKYIDYYNRVKAAFGRNITEVIIGTDADREGEAIAWELINEFGYIGKIRRAWFSAGLDKTSLKYAMSNLLPSEDRRGFGRASEARSWSDYPYMYMVRAFTYYAKYGVFGKDLTENVGVGRVQTPTLNLIVRREEEIRNFVIRDHFEIAADFMPFGTDVVIAGKFKPSVTLDIIGNRPSGVTWIPSKRVVKDGEPEPLDEPLYTDRSVVDAFKNRLLSAKDRAVVVTYTESEELKYPPKPYQLLEAKSALMKETKLSNDVSQTVIEDLYEQGYITYPRTDRNELPMSFYTVEFNGLLDNLKSIAELREQTEFVRGIHAGLNDRYPKFTPKCFTTGDMPHHGLAPSKKRMTDSDLSAFSAKKQTGSSVSHNGSHMRSAYLIIVKQFLQAMYPPSTYKKQKATFSVPVEDILGNKDSIFSASGSILVDAGYLSAFKSEFKETQLFKALKPNQNILLSDVTLSAKQTTPPERYREDTFENVLANIAKEITDPVLRERLKDSKGIGTSATRQTIVAGLLKRGYITKDKGCYAPTLKGYALINVVPDFMKKPETTAMWEDFLVKICHEKDDNRAIAMRDAFVGKQGNLLEQYIAYMIENYDSKKGELIETPRALTPKTVDYAKKIAAFKRETLTKQNLSDPKFINDYIKKYNDEREKIKAEKEAAYLVDPRPSDAQIKYLGTIIPHLPSEITVPEDVYSDSKKLTAFINAHGHFKPEAKEKPPTEKQIAAAKTIFAKIPSDVKEKNKLNIDKVIKSMQSTSDFIQKYGAKKK